MSTSKAPIRRVLTVARVVVFAGYEASFNGKFRNELLNGEIFYTLREAQVIIECWRQEYNTFRPHSGLGYRPPAPETVPWPGLGDGNLSTRAG